MDQELADLYTVLGLGRDAGPDDIEAAYAARLARADAGQPVDEAVRERVRYAYDVLSSPQRRNIYDSLIAETTDAPFRVELTLSRAKLPLLDQPQLIYALIALTPRRSTDEGRRPLNLGLVVDHSTSMRGERLENVIAAVSLLLSKMGPDDSLSLVSFSDRAEVVLPAASPAAGPQSADAAGHAAWLDPHRSLRQIVASGGTEIYHGLRAGLEQVASRAAEGVISHLILLTDGHTYGDAADCLRLAESAAARGVGLTAFGLGADWNDAFLDALVAPSGGQSRFIERPEDVLAHLEGRLQGLGAIHARSLALDRVWPDQLSPRAGFKLAPFPQPLNLEADPIPLGDLEGRSPMTVLLEYLIAPQPVAARFRLPVGIHYTAAGETKSAQRETQLVVQKDGAADEDRPPTVLIEVVRRLNLYRMQEKAWEEAQSGKPDTAAARMRRLTARYMETGDLRLAEQARLEAQQLDHLGAMSPEGRKRLKYGTRSLMGQTGS
jgi:Ca-activated chloride channel family protein